MVNHLVPIESPFELGSHYLPSLREKLLPDIGATVNATMVCLPSFDANWSVRIFGSDDGGYGAAVTVEDWSSEQDVTTKSANIDSSLASELAGAWCKVTARTKLSSSESFGLDGVTYHFLANDPRLGRLSGRTWSPDPDTTPGHLVSLGKSLRWYVESRVDSQVDRFRELRQQLDWFHDIPLRPPMQEDSTTLLQTAIKYTLQLHERGWLTDEQVALQLIVDCQQIGYPTIAEILDPQRWGTPAPTYA